MGAFWGYFLDFFGVQEPGEERRPAAPRREIDPRDPGRGAGDAEPIPVTHAAPGPGARHDQTLRQ